MHAPVWYHIPYGTCFAVSVRGAHASEACSADILIGYYFSRPVCMIPNAMSKQLPNLSRVGSTKWIDYIWAYHYVCSGLFVSSYLTASLRMSLHSSGSTKI